MLLSARTEPLLSRLTRFYLDYSKMLHDYEWGRIYLHSGLGGAGIAQRFARMVTDRVYARVVGELRRRSLRQVRGDHLVDDPSVFRIVAVGQVAVDVVELGEHRQVGVARCKAEVLADRVAPQGWQRCREPAQTFGDLLDVLRRGRVVELEQDDVPEHVRSVSASSEEPAHSEM